ncbi:rab-GTPase-TBC domain-containing protein [Pyronema domesticum]|nr:rab-GTPase-TBC domain-containing protein [Pyronema domesticum]
MVTIRLSDSEPELPSLPSPTPTLKLVDERSEEFVLADKGPIFVPERSESPVSSKSLKEGGAQNSVDWEGLEKTEDVTKEEASEEGANFLLARLEQENKRLEQDPRSIHTHPERPPSMATLRNMMDNPDPNTMRYSMLPAPPPLTDLEFYAALVSDYNKCASRLPHLLSKKIRAGIPPPLRGVVWVSMSGARDCNLEGLYDQLLGETSPYETLIGKDVGRTGLEMFSQEGGEGQRMLGRLLRAFSIYDTQIGYCQGLGFLVGPLLMHMGEREAFCVLVRLMEFYDLRSCFLPNLYGLQLRMFQFTHLLATVLPELSQHLENLGIQPHFASQWFLSFFAVTCPLPMLFRIYDVIFAEGAPETMMRVALSLMRRNEKRLLSSAEFEDVQQMLLSRSLWDVFRCNADDLVQDFVSLSGVVTREVLADLEKKFKEHEADAAKPTPAKPQQTDLQAAASRFLGRLWGGPNNGVTLNVPSRPSSIMQRSSSKQSLSTLNSFDASDTSSGHSTEASSVSSANSSMSVPDDRRLSTRSVASKRANKDLELHNQIEDLLVALSGLQREHAMRMDELQAVKESRENERKLTRRLIELMAQGAEGDQLQNVCDEITDALDKEDDEENIQASKTATAQLAQELQLAREELSRQMIKCRNVSNRLAEQDADVVRLKSQLLDTRDKCTRIQNENQQLQKSLSSLRQQRRYPDTPDSPDSTQEKKGGLRELRLGRDNRSNSNAKKPPTPTSATFARRSSSLGMQSLLGSTPANQPIPEDALLLELVNAKTAEAMAKADAEEAKAKLEALRKVLGGSGTVVNIPPSPAPSINNGGGGWFGGGWGAKRTVDSR